MFFHVILTTRCNLECRYCSGEASRDFSPPSPEIDYSLPDRPSYTTADLKGFLEKDADAHVIFYGGEPLLAADLIGEIIDTVNARAFIIQTNGTLLRALDPRHLRRLHTIAVSVDGDEAQTDLNRGGGTFRRVLENLRWAIENGFSGELIARMTVMEPLDIYKQVRWLLSNDEFSFSSVHWQLNAGFWDDYSERDFERWVRESYNPGVRRLVSYWVDHMKTAGRVLRIYPLIGIADSLLRGEESRLRCGAGWANYAIQTDGHIIPCPAMWGLRRYYLGHIKTSRPGELKKVDLGEPCASCDILGKCGGRCLYANVMKRWGPDASGVICETVRNLIGSIEEKIPTIRGLIERGVIAPEDFSYMKYNGCEIIP